MADEQFINVAEQSLATALFEKMTGAYGVGETVNTIEFNPFGEDIDDIEFDQQRNPIEKVTIYQSETPSLFVNLDSNDSPPESHTLSISFFIDTVRETDGEEINETIAEIEMTNDLVAISKITQKMGFNKALGPLDLIEGIIYYRQALILQKTINESKLFTLDDTFYVTAFVHGILDTKDEKLWEYCEKTLGTPIAEVLTEVGFSL